MQKVGVPGGGAAAGWPEWFWVDTCYVNGQQLSWADFTDPGVSLCSDDG